VKVALPFPAAVPISNVVVPASEPDPDVKVTTKGKLAGKPDVDGFPYASRACTTGCTPNGEPARDNPPGCDKKTNRSAAPAETTTGLETVLVNPDVEN